MPQFDSDWIGEKIHDHDTDLALMQKDIIRARERLDRLETRVRVILETSDRMTADHVDTRQRVMRLEDVDRVRLESKVTPPERELPWQTQMRADADYIDARYVLIPAEGEPLLPLQEIAVRMRNMADGTRYRS